MGFGCYMKDGRLTWSQGSAKKFNLSVAQLDQLYNILIWAKPAELQELAISISRDTLRLSKFPNLLAKGRNLTRVTLLSGAENHTLRILGTNCHNLKYLDVSHSVRVTDYGLKGLLLKRPPRRRVNYADDVIAAGPGSMSESDSNDRYYLELTSLETNRCADTLLNITLLGTSVTWEGCDQTCKLLTSSAYLYSSLPIVKIVKIRHMGGIFEKSIVFNRRSLGFVNNTTMDDNMQFIVGSSIDSILGPYDIYQFPIVDRLVIPSSSSSHRSSEEEKSYIFVRRADSFKLALHMKLDGMTVTSLVMPWYTFTWKMDSLVSLDILGVSFPNLKFLRGRVKGIWNRDDVPFLPHLQVACVWSLNSTTGLSMLQNAPDIKIFEFNNTQTLINHPGGVELTDLTLKNCLSTNPKLTRSIEEITLRPAELTLVSLRALVQSCPNLKRIGDLESWKITTDEIADFNRYLDSIRSQCVLSVMNFPPSLGEKFEWI